MELQDRLQVGCSVSDSLLAICVATFLDLQQLHKVDVGSNFCIDFCETIASCSPRDATCNINMSSATCNGFLLQTLGDLQEKLHCVTLANLCNQLKSQNS